MEKKKEGVEESKKTLAELYNGIPDDSVDLTFSYLTIHNDRNHNPLPKPKNTTEQVTESIAVKDYSTEIRESSALDQHRDREDKEINRTGIPHSNFCALCSSYLRFVRHRCLVCGRVYCKNCVGIGMGKMTEGRKCKDCLGRRFSQRYITRAGKFGCCISYPSEMKQQELIWAEKGPSKKYSSGIESGQQSQIIRGNPQSPKARNGPAFIVTMSPGFSLTSQTQDVGLSWK